MSTARLSRTLAQLLCVSLLAAAPLCQAQTFPQRTVKIVLPYAPGGGADVFSRMIAEELTKRWKQPVIVENRAGGASIIGAEAVVRSAPDGHTMLLSADGPITTNPHLFKKLPFDPMKELAPVTLLVTANLFVVASPSFGASTLAEVVSLARQKPNEFNYSSWGTGTGPHLFFEALKREAGVELRHIPYKAAVAANTAVVTGEVHVSALGNSALPQIAAGKMKPLAVCSPARLAFMPNTPTCTEAGFAKADPKNWFGIFVPAGTPAAAISAIYAGTSELLNNPEFTGRTFFKENYSRVNGSPAEFAKFLKEDFEDKGRLIRNAGIAPE